MPDGKPKAFSGEKQLLLWSGSQVGGSHPAENCASVEMARRLTQRGPERLGHISYGLVGLLRTGKRSGNVIVMVFWSRLIFGGRPRTR
jgi:hypothetical protein